MSMGKSTQSCDGVNDSALWMKELSTTSFAVLGLLALRPWSTYELARQMKRGLHYFWRSAESGVYEEPKKLVARGLAKAEFGHVGRRPRTVYTITPKGRAALRDWLGVEPAPAHLALEALVKVWFGEQGTKDELLAAIDSIRNEAEGLLSHAAGLAREYLGEAPPFPERLHVNTLVFKFMWDYAETVTRWSDWAEAEIAGWPGVTQEAGATPALDILHKAAAYKPKCSDAAVASAPRLPDDGDAHPEPPPTP
jgi:PadR family transcriptional regulator, regulatory protein AphA